MTDVNAIQAEIEEATGLEQKPREGAAKYRARLVRAAMSGKQKLSDEDFAELSEEAQAWLNEGTKALKGKKTVPDFPEDDEEVDEDEEAEEADEEDEDDDDEEDEDDDDEDDDEEEEEPAPRRGKGKGKGKSAKADAPKKTRSRSGATTVFRRIILENPGAKLEDLFAIAEEQGLELAEASAKTLVYHTNATVAILNDLGVDLSALGGSTKKRKKRSK